MTAHKETLANDHNHSNLNVGACNKYRLVVVCVRGNVSVRETMRSILRDIIDASGLLPVLVLGPTAHVEIISPDNLLEVNLFIEKALQGQSNQVILGDFLDNIIKSTESSESFYSFFCQLASRVKLKKRTAILVIKEDIHDRPMVEIVKRFADVVLEFRDQDIEGALKVEMRTLNFADNIYTSWRPFPEGLRPLAVST